jgi:hypothetical protein
VKKLLLLAILALVLTLLAILPSGCRTDGCLVAATRCVDNVAEVCDADGTWSVALDCDDLTRQTMTAWVCAADPLGADAGVLHTCIFDERAPLVARGDAL